MRTNKRKRSGSLLILCIIVFITTVNVFAAEIKGVITDADKNTPLSGVNVTVKGTDTGASTNAHGEYTIKGIQPGTYSLVISMMGYKEQIQSVNVSLSKSATANAELSPIVIPMQAVQIMGRSTRNIIENPEMVSPGLGISTTIIDRKEIEKQAPVTLIDAMQYIPGAVVETRGRKVKQFFSVRGQRYPYPDYAIDGVWQKEFHETPYVFPASMIESIQIIRSSAALLSGLGGLSGVIDVKTREFEDPETTTELEYGSFNTLRGNVSHGATRGTVSYAGGIGYYQTDGPDDRHAAETLANGFAKVKWQPSDKFYVQSSIIHLNGSRELATGLPPAADKFQVNLEEFDPVKTSIVSLRSQYIESENASTEIKLSYADRKPVYHSENTKSGAVAEQNEYDHEFNAGLIQSLSLIPNNVLRAGLLYNHWVAPEGKRFYAGKPCDTETIAAVLTDEHQFGRLQIDAGFKWQRSYYNEYGGFGIDGSAKGFQKVEPIMDEWQKPLLIGSLGMSYYLNQSITLNLNVSAGSIEPRSGSLDVNMAEPLNEKRNQIDAGVHYNIENVGDIAFTAFTVYQQDAIVLSGKTYTLNDKVMELYLNRDQVQTGIEVEARANTLWETIQPFCNVTWMVSKQDEDGDMVESKEFPTLVSSAGIYGKWSRLDVNMLIKYISSFENSRFSAIPEPQPLGDFVNMDIIAGWDFAPLLPVHVYAEIRNVTDELYSTVVGFPDFGRRFNLRVVHRF